MLGVSMQRLCPDQTATEAARKAYVKDALYVPPPTATKRQAKSGGSAQTPRKFRSTHFGR